MHLSVDVYYQCYQVWTESIYVLTLVLKKQKHQIRLEHDYYIKKKTVLSVKAKFIIVGFILHCFPSHLLWSAKDILENTHIHTHIHSSPSSRKAFWISSSHWGGWKKHESMSPNPNCVFCQAGFYSIYQRQHREFYHKWLLR